MYGDIRLLKSFYILATSLIPIIKIIYMCVCVCVCVDVSLMSELFMVLTLKLLIMNNLFFSFKFAISKF